MHAVTENDDRPNVAEARTGNHAAWDRLFQRYQLPLFTYVVDLIRDSGSSFDLVQEVFLRAVRHLPSLRDDRRFGSWLFGIAHQLVLAHWRRRGRSPIDDTELPETTPDTAEAPDEALLRTDDTAKLLASLDALPEHHRSVLLLHFLEDLSLAEIAEIQGLSIGTVKSRLHYAKRTLRQRLTASTEGP